MDRLYNCAHYLLLRHSYTREELSNLQYAKRRRLPA